MEGAIQHVPVTYPIDGGYNRGYDGASRDARAYAQMGANSAQDIRHDVGVVHGEVKQTEADIRSDVKDVGSNVRSDIGRAQCDITHAVKDAESRLGKDVVENRFILSNRISDLERNVDVMFCKTNENVIKEASLTREYVLKEAYQTREKANELARWQDDKSESRFLRTWDKSERIEDKIEKEGEKTRFQLHAFEKSVDEKFCRENERELQSKIDELRLKVQCCECSGPTSSEIADTVLTKLAALNVLGGGPGNGGK